MKIVHQIWELVLKNHVIQANWKGFIQMFVTDRKRKKNNGKGGSSSNKHKAMVREESGHLLI